MKQEDKKIINLNNNRSITQENYEVLAKKFKNNMQRADHFLYKVGRLFDEAFTKYRHSNPNNDKLKDFEIHEARQIGKDTASKYYQNAEKDIATVEAKAKERGIALDILVEREKMRKEEEELNKKI